MSDSPRSKVDPMAIDAQLQSFIRQGIDRRFTFHPPRGPSDVRAYEMMREGGRQLALLILDLAPDGPERQEAFKHVQSAIMWGNAAIAIEGSRERSEG